MHLRIRRLSAFLAFGGTLGVSLVAAQDFVSYTPVTPVADTAALDLDLFLLEDLLSESRFEQAKKLYSQGGNSGSYAVLQLATPLDANANVNLPAGSLVVGNSLDNGGEVRGTLMEDLTAGASEVLVAYETTDDQRGFVGCRVGGHPNPDLDGCFVGVGSVTIGAPSQGMRLSLSYAYDPMTDNLNARSFQSMSLESQQKMYDCGDACPYPIYNEFYNYFGRFDYADAFIQAAFDRTTAEFALGNMDFSGFADDSGIVEAVEKGSVYLNLWMYTIQSMEEAIASCNSDTGKEVSSWDQAVAVYAGSIIRITGGNEGNMLLTMADQRCRNFGTCVDGTNGLARANMELLREFEVGQTSLVNKDCAAAAATKDRIVNWMTVPMVQGAIRFAELLSQDEWLGFQRAHATGAVYAAAVLPRLHACNQQDADTLYASLRPGKLSQLVDFAAVKRALERNYDCMGITCADVGGLIDRNTGQFLAGAEPCTDGDADQPTEANEDGVIAVDQAQPTESQPEEEALDEEPQDDPTVQPEEVEEEQDVDQQGVDDTVGDVQSVVEEDATEIQSKEDCPPCGDSIVAAARANNQCDELVEDQFESIPSSCACACFVDSKYAFCASTDRSYKGDGFLVGPCELQEEEAIASESIADSGMASNSSWTGNTTNVDFVAEEDEQTMLVDTQEQEQDVEVNDPDEPDQSTPMETENAGGLSGYSTERQTPTSSAYRYIPSASLSQQVCLVALASLIRAVL